MSVLRQASIEGQRLLALLGYGLLFAGVLTAGLSALAAALLAAGQSEGAHEALKPHFEAQTRIFWRAFWAWLIGLAGLMAGLTVAANGGFAVDLRALEIAVDSQRAWVALWTLAGSAVILAIGVAYAMLASALGFIRLASAGPIGETGEP